jgi:hypothetical protein
MARPQCDTPLVLFCFVFFGHAEISRTMMLHVALLVCSESSRRVGVHWLGLRLFGATLWKLLIIEPFSQWQLNKIKTGNYIGILGVLESPWWVRFNRVYFTIFRAKVWKILILKWILLLEIQTNCKNWVCKEIAVEAGAN